MEINSIEKILNQMSKPEISNLEHSDLLINEILKAKDRTVLSAWWLSIPLYIIASLLMKSFFMPGTSLISNMHDFIKSNQNTALGLFIILPIVFAGLNFYSIYKMYIFHRSLKPLFYSLITWVHLITIMVCLVIILIYLI